MTFGLFRLRVVKCIFLPNSVVHYCLTNNEHFTFPANALPEQLHSQKEIVELMANYMEQNLMEVREKPSSSGVVGGGWQRSGGGSA